MDNWKDKTCRKCEYRGEDSCRRFPPNLPSGVYVLKNNIYPQVRMDRELYQRACAEYKEVLNDDQEA
jgi:hypothetical protein